LSVSAESLGGDDTISGGAFRTPLATLHAFQGWAADEAPFVDTSKYWLMLSADY